MEIFSKIPVFFKNRYLKLEIDVKFWILKKKKRIIWKLLVRNFLHEVSQYQHKITSISLKKWILYWKIHNKSATKSNKILNKNKVFDENYKIHKFILKSKPTSTNRSKQKQENCTNKNELLIFIIHNTFTTCYECTIPNKPL